MYDQYDRLLQQLSVYLQTAPLTFDGEGLCNICIDDERPITIRRDMDRGRIVLLGLLLETTPETFSGRLLHEILCMGLHSLLKDASGLGMDPDTGMLLLHHAIPIGNLDADSLMALLDRFASQQKEWTEKLTAVSQT